MEITFENIEELNEENVRDLSDAQIKKLVDKAEFEFTVANADQMAIKLAINSMYGVFANKYFHFFSYALASTITAQGRFTTQSTEKQFNKYFKEVWPDDKKLHESMGLESVTPISSDVAIYCDTDSVYFALDRVMENVDGWKHEDDRAYGGTKFLKELYEKRLDRYFQRFFDKYSEKFGVENLLDLELEKIARSGTFLAKKKYALDVSWTEGGPDGIYFEPKEYVSFSGGEIVQKSTPKYVKDKLKKMIIWLLDQDLSKYNPSQLLQMINEIREEYFLQDIDVIAKSITMNDYEKYVISDTKPREIGLRKGATFQVKAASLYNNMLQTKYDKLKSKYPLIRSGDQIKYYYADTGLDGFERFGYLPNMFPYEFAPPIDKEKQFAKSFVDPFNFYLKAVGLSPVDRNLHITASLF